MELTETVFRVPIFACTQLGQGIALT